jgi:dCTP diphosphatase
MSDVQGDFEQLAAVLRSFAEKRDWEKFHTPKNLAMAVAGEAGELAAEFQWLTPTESECSALSPEQLDAVAMEIADVQIYLIRLADVLGIDIPDVVRKKIAINESRF